MYKKILISEINNIIVNSYRNLLNELWLRSVKILWNKNRPDDQKTFELLLEYSIRNEKHTK